MPDFHLVLALPGLLQVVAFQAMMELMADNFPGVFSGYDLHVVESHQRNKADTSGTAKAVVQSFNKMGLDYKEVSHPCHLLMMLASRVLLSLVETARAHLSQLYAIAQA